MTVKVEGALRRTWALGKQYWTKPAVRELVVCLGWAAAAMVFSAASLGEQPVPMAMGLIMNLGGLHALAALVGAGVGYRLFWGPAGLQGIWWALGGGILSVLSPPKKLQPALSVLVVSAVGLWFQLARGQHTPPDAALLRCLLAGGFAWVFSRRDRVGRWLQCGAWCLALAQIAPRGWPGLGFAAASALAVGASFPAAALGAAGVELAQVTALPLTAVVLLAWLARLLQVRRRYRWLLPGAVALVVMTALGIREYRLLPGLLLGGGLGMLLPREGQSQPRRGETGFAQVRLELAAGIMKEFRRVLMALPPPVIDREALLHRVRSRACAACPARRGCLEQSRLTVTALEDSRPFSCRKERRLAQELSRSREQLRRLKAEHRRREEYRQALAGQFFYLSEYLRSLSDQLPRRGEKVKGRYGVSVGVRTRGRSSANGDRWAAFPAGRGKYYVLLCDGMGTGNLAQEEGKNALILLRQLLAADYPPEHALRSLNSLLVLTGRPGAVTVDLAELRLDTGQVRLFKWGAAPSWRIVQGRAEKIGTATPPPGCTVVQAREWSARLSLKRGEMLILISDGVDGEDVPRRVYNAPDAPPGELAERLLEGSPGGKEDDATAAVIRMYPRNLATS